jgi:arylsulfatase A-like enzyme
MKDLVSNTFKSVGILGALVAMSTSSCKTPDEGADASRPNIIYILADDLGYGDLGCYGQKKIETPNIDKLASEGMLFTQHYSGSPVCAPARCMLLTGIHSGKAQIRGNEERYERGDIWSYHAMLADSSLEGQQHIKAGTNTIGRVLQSAGYKTAVVGKWGLGAPDSEGAPNKQGFDFFYGYICQRQAHTYYPVHLWRNDKREFLTNDTVPPHTPLQAGLDPYDINSYKQFELNDYAPTLMLKEINRFIDENQANPFFLYWATPIPHLPLQAPKKWVDYYVEKFGDEEPYAGVPGRGNYTPARYPNATYAAMISYHDEQVGKLVEQLKELGLYENTLIIVSSDNGPSGSINPWFESAAPFRTQAGYTKGSLYEGGIRVPMIACWPNKIIKGTVTNHISSFPDVMPTLAEIAGVIPPEDVTGISFLPTLLGKAQPAHEYLYWEFPQRHEAQFWKFPPNDGLMAVRIGNMKALRKGMHQGNMKWELFDLEKDPQERNDISALHPEILKKVDEIVSKEHTVAENPVFHFEMLGDSN